MIPKLGGPTKSNKTGGFTIVELLVVIVVIAILASITVMSFTGVQRSARDVVRKADLSNIAKTLQIYSISHGGDMFGHGSGCGADGNGSGWWHSDEAKYTMSTQECLVQAGLTQMGDINDPSGCYGGVEGCTGKPRYMIVHCSKDSDERGYVFAQLETVDKDPNYTVGLCDAGTSPGFVDINDWGEVYGVNYKVQLY